MELKIKDKMTSLEKGLYLLSLFAEEPYELSVPDLVEMTGINITTIYRTLSSLEEAGMLIRDDMSKVYKMGPMTYHMGNVYLHHANYKKSIEAILKKISYESNESVGIAHREGNNVISIYAIENNHHLKVNDKPGTFYSMNKGCFGKCLMAYYNEDIVKSLLEEAVFEKTASKTLTTKEEILSEYEQIRKQGFVTSLDEVASYICGVGVPLRSPDGRVDNVVAISFLRQGDYEEKVERLKEILFKYKAEIERYLI